MDTSWSRHLGLCTLFKKRHISTSETKPDPVMPFVLEFAAYLTKSILKCLLEQEEEEVRERGGETISAPRIMSC